MTDPKRSLIGSVAAGIIAALVTLTVFEGLRPAPKHQTHTTPTTEAEPKTVTREATPVQVVRSDLEPMHALQAEVARLKREVEEQRPTPTPPPDPEAEEKRVEAYFAELERRHLGDPIDPSWAPSATAALESGLLKLSQRYGFFLRSTECKTTYCRASLDWKDYASAQGAGAVLAETTFAGLNCTQSVRLKGPEDPRAVYATDLYLDCTSLRAGAVEVATAPD
jgi:hypothetical protein